MSMREFLSSHSKLYWSDGPSRRLFEYNIVTGARDAHKLRCAARYISHIDNNVIFYSCPNVGIYSLNLISSDTNLVYQDAFLNTLYGDVTSYLNTVYFAREHCVFSVPAGGGGPLTLLSCIPVAQPIQYLTAAHPALQP